MALLALRRGCQLDPDLREPTRLVLELGWAVRELVAREQVRHDVERRLRAEAAWAVCPVSAAAALAAITTHATPSRQ